MAPKFGIMFERVLLPKGFVLFEEGGKCDTLYLIFHGEVTLSKTWVMV